MFLGSIGAETSKPLTLQLTPMGNDLSVRPQPSSQKISSFVSWMEAWNIYLAILIDHFPSTCPTASGLPKDYNFSQYTISTCRLAEL